MSERTIKFGLLCDMLEAISKARKLTVKRKHLHTFFDHVYTERNCYSILRLLLPSLDKDRPAYGLKEPVLAKCIADALGLAKDSPDARRLLDWKKGPSGTAGNFPLIAVDVFYRRLPTTSGNLSIKDINECLDELASSDKREDKTQILAALMKKTNVKEITWIVKFILKDLKLGVSEKTILQVFHPDAESLLNVNCDLKLVCEKLKDRKERVQIDGIVVGVPSRPQLACRVSDVEEAWRKLRGKPIVAECKFDGDRIQLHKNGEGVHFFSRAFIDHKEYTEGMASIIQQRIKDTRCILDGEMMVWNKITGKFAEFGSNQGAAKAAKDGLETDEQLCYVVFDILYAMDRDLTGLPLNERQAFLRKVVDPLRGSLELVLPGHGFCAEKDHPPWSIVVKSPEEINKFFLQTVENREEGIVLKDMSSKWEPGDRSQKWLKLKPDYVHAENDLDALIIGCFVGSGRRGGVIGQFLLGLAEKPKGGGYPTKFLSFCRVGTGLSDSECDDLVCRLKPYLKKNDRITKPPGCYLVTNIGKERPDFWVEQPEKSVILQITSDIRSIRSEYFATPFSLRFPRIQRIRYDKPWFECLDVDGLVDIVHSRSGDAPETKIHEKRISRPRVGRKAKRDPSSLSVIPSHMLSTDVSQVKQETTIFKGLVIYFINFEPELSRDHLHTLVVRNGGVFAMNLSISVTHAIAAQKQGMQFKAAASQRDVLHLSWVLDCCAQRCLLPLRPKYFLHLLKGSNVAGRRDVDEFGDNYYEDLDVVDLQHMFTNMNPMDLAVSKADISRFESKHCKQKGFGEFCGCRVFFCSGRDAYDEETHVVADIVLKRLELGLLISKGDVVRNTKEATHCVIYYPNENLVPLKRIMQTLPVAERRTLMSEKLHVVKHGWLEDALENKVRSKEDAYNLKNSHEVSILEDVLALNDVNYGKDFKMQSAAFGLPGKEQDCHGGVLDGAERVSKPTESMKILVQNPKGVIENTQEDFFEEREKGHKKRPLEDADAMRGGVLRKDEALSMPRPLSKRARLSKAKPTHIKSDEDKDFIDDGKKFSSSHRIADRKTAMEEDSPLSGVSDVSYDDSKVNAPERDRKMLNPDNVNQQSVYKQWTPLPGRVDEPTLAGSSAPAAKKKVSYRALVQQLFDT